MLHPLFGAELRVKRAGEHLADLEARIMRLRQAENDRFPFDLDPETQDFRFGPFPVPGPEVHAALGEEFCVLVGEIIYNLRTALDYLVFEIARLDSGAEQDGTQFLIEDTPKGFAGRRKAHLKGLNVKHVTAIETLQPYKGCDWTALLRDLSNRDKHRHLTVIARTAEHIVRVSKNAPGTFDHVTRGKVYRTKESDGTESDMHVEPDFALHVTLADGAPLVETLQQLISRTSESLEAFKPEFKR